MENTSKLLVGALAVLAIVFVLTQGELTGKAVSPCSEIPELTTAKAVGDTVSLNWKDTSTLKGKQPKYEVVLFKKQEDGTFSFNEAFENDMVEETFASFTFLDKDTSYIARVRAKNPWDCPTKYSGYATSEEINIITE